MRIASLGKDLNIYPFKSKINSRDNKSWFMWGNKFNQYEIPLHDKYPPYMKCLDNEAKIYQVVNGYAYFINRNKFVIADDKKKDPSDLLICVGLRLRRDHKGKCIIIENQTKRLYCDFKVITKKDPGYCYINSFVFIKDGEKATLVDYLSSGEYSDISILQDGKEWFAERTNIKMLEPMKEREDGVHPNTEAKGEK